MIQGSQLSKDNHSKLSEESEALLSAPAEQEKFPVQCSDDQAGLSGVVIYENDTFSMSNPSQCEENPQDIGGKRA
ncbi:hypothetical protein PHYPO_G00058580 [Pangasianodon hypophthalmus]|uniref:Uncharacterized protein n=1 Tax=Pangasianodon hypophthalmus TaxID=310915 RepID=A0A5N5M0S8_PANHP|nr:hypothetical protein PHYPO_G00058580 [Pangasianodon hypophthalmus]